MNSTEEKSPWLTIWREPRKTIRSIVEKNPNTSLALLSTLYGFTSLLSIAQMISLGSRLSLFSILLFSLLIAPAWGYIFLSIHGGVVWILGKILKGEGHFRQIRSVIAWANVPLVISVVCWIVLFMVFGNALFQKLPAGSKLSFGQSSVIFITLLAQLAVTVWRIVIFLKGLSQVQKFSIGKAIFNGIFAVVFWILLGFIVIMALSQ